MTLRTTWVSDEQAFAALREPWDALSRTDPTPFMDHAWLTAWWAAFADGRALAVCTVWDGDDLRAALPLARGRGRTFEALANTHSPTFRPLAADDAAARALAGAVLAEGDVLVPCLPAGDAAATPLRGRRGRRLVAVEPQHISPSVTLDGDFESFRERTKPRWGAPLERFARKMARDHDAHFSLVEAPRDLEAELAAGFRVEASGWKGSAGTAIVSRPETERFYREVAHAYAATDGLRLSGVTLDGTLVAFDLCLLAKGRLHLLKTGFEESFRRLAPGLVLRLRVIERCFELGLESHELGGGSDPWKLKFADAERPHVVLRSLRPRPAGALRWSYRRAVRPAMRRAYRAVRTRGER